MFGPAETHKALLIAFASNLATAIAKLAAAIYTGSGAMLAETVHSLVAGVSQGLLLWGLKAGRTAPTPDYPSGFGKGLYFWSFIITLMLFSLGGALCIYESGRKLSDPESMRAPWLPIAVLVFSMLCQCIGLWTCLRGINKARGNQTPWRWLCATSHSELRILLGEHLAALFGLCLAMLAISLSALTDNPLYDCVGGIGIGVLLLGVSVGVGVEIKRMLSGKPFDGALKSAISSHLQMQPTVAQLCELLTVQCGAEVLVIARLRLAAASADTPMPALSELEASLLASFPQVQRVFLQPV